MGFPKKGPKSVALCSSVWWRNAAVARGSERTGSEKRPRILPTPYLASTPWKAFWIVPTRSATPDPRREGPGRDLTVLEGGRRRVRRWPSVRLGTQEVVDAGRLDERARDIPRDHALP